MGKQNISKLIKSWQNGMWSTVYINKQIVSVQLFLYDLICLALFLYIGWPSSKIALCFSESEDSRSHMK